MKNQTTPLRFLLLHSCLTVGQPQKQSHGRSGQDEKYQYQTAPARHSPKAHHPLIQFQHFPPSVMLDMRIPMFRAPCLGRICVAVPYPFHLCITKLSTVNLMLFAVMPGMPLPDGCRPRGLSALSWMQHRGAPVPCRMVFRC